MDSGSIFHFSCQIFTKLAKMTYADRVMNPRHFGRYPADIRINLSIRIGIQDRFWLKFWCWQRSALSEHSLVVHVVLASLSRLSTTAFCFGCFTGTLQKVSMETDLCHTRLRDIRFSRGLY